MTRLEEACERYLSSRPFTLWSDWDLSHEDRKQEAVKWLAEQYRCVNEELARPVAVHMTAQEFEDYELSMTIHFDPPMLHGQPIFVDGKQAQWKVKDE